MVNCILPRNDCHVYMTICHISYNCDLIFMCQWSMLIFHGLVSFSETISKCICVYIWFTCLSGLVWYGSSDLDLIDIDH